ncbi:MAG: HAMP domain-containing histidine kinase [Lachnospiraceae bacterium]|nr:HAMP domain-containing histidine kinase [Lachnospiraceae bacterium]
MKFTGKLFLWIMVLVTAAFIAFGMWMLDSSFSRMLEQERQQASQEIRMFQYFLEVGYRSGEEYGEVYALQRALESMTINVDRTGSNCIVLDGEGNCYSGQQELTRLSGIVDVDEMIVRRNEAGENSYIWQICMDSRGYELVSMSDSRLGDKTYYLLVSRNIQGIYDTRTDTIRQYRVMLLVLLTVAAVCAWVLARYLTRPIRKLGWVTKRIAAGDLTRRSDYHQPDEVGELAESFNLMADRLVEQMREKELEAKRQEDFTAAFAHELKTPLTSIIGYAQMLDTMELEPEEHRTASHYIYTQGKRLEQLSHKLLELVSMEKQDFAGKPIKAMTLGENLWSTMRPIWDTRQIQGSIRMEQATLWGDSDLLLSLLYNLLDNATKAVGEKGQISLEGRHVRDKRSKTYQADFDDSEWGVSEPEDEPENVRKPKGGKWYGIRIRDNGRGIPQEEIDRITEPFYMVDKSRSRKEGGAGLGMSLCQRILQLHGGSWKVKSTLGEGTEILIRLPLTAPK